MQRALFILCLLATSFAASAQEVETLVEAKFRTFPVLSAIWKGIFYQPAPKADMIEVDFRSLSRSFFTYDYQGPEVLSFYREDGLNAAGEMQYRPVGALKVSAGEMLIFFKLNPSQAEGEPEFSLLATDDSPSGLPNDHIVFINFTRANFACRLDKQDMILRPGASGPISIADSLKQRLFIGLAVSYQQTHRVVLKNTWEFHPGNRHLILLLPPKKAGSFRIRAYRVADFVGEKKRFNPNWMPEIPENESVPKM